MNILVVEDNSTTQLAMQEILDLHKYKVDHAGNGYGAITRLEIAIPDVIIADYLMPGMDGLDFIKYLRQIDKWRSIPVILITALANIDMPELISEINNLHPVIVLHKPFDMSNLVEILHKLEHRLTN